MRVPWDKGLESEEILQRSWRTQKKRGGEWNMENPSKTVCTSNSKANVLDKTKWKRVKDEDEGWWRLGVCGFIGYKYKLTTGLLLSKLCHIPNLCIQFRNYKKFNHQVCQNSLERGISIGGVDGRGHIEKKITFSDESENPPAINDPSWDIEEQLKLRWYAKK